MAGVDSYDALQLGAAYNEAQKLIDEWMQRKLIGSIDFEDAILEDKSLLTGKKAVDIKREWDHLVMPDEDIYAVLEQDDELLVQDVLKQLNESNLDIPNRLKLLKEQKNTSKLSLKNDFRLKSDLRRQMLLEKRTQRENFERRRLEETAEQRKLAMRAEMILRQEQEQEELHAKEEEKAINLQMEEIQIQRNLEKKRRKEIEIQMQQEKQLEEFELKRNAAIKREELEKILSQSIKDKEQRKRRVCLKIGEIEIKNKIKEKQLLQNSFSALRQVALQSKIVSTKATFSYRWRLCVRVFNAWKTLAQATRYDREVLAAEERIRKAARDELSADSLHVRQLHRRYFCSWKRSVHGLKLERRMEEERTAKQEKIDELIQAAASGRRFFDPTPMTTLEMHENLEKKSFQKKPSKKAGKGKTEETNDENSRSKPSLVPSSRRRSAAGSASTTGRPDVRDVVVKEQQLKLREQEQLIAELLQLQRQQASAQGMLSEQICQRSTGTELGQRQTAKSGDSLAPAGRSLSHRSVGEANNTPRKPPTSKLTKFQLEMDARAAERNRIHNERLERRRQLDELRLNRLRTEEENLKKAEEEKRHERQMMIKAQRQKEREFEEHREKLHKKLHVQMCRARFFYENWLLKSRGFKPWRRLMAAQRFNERKAAEYYRAELLRKTFLSWCCHVETTADARSWRVETFLSRTRLRKAFRRWTMLKSCLIMQGQKAADFHNAQLLGRSFKLWAEFTCDERIKTRRLRRLAEDHHERYLLRNCFHSWCRLPSVLLELQQQYNRKLQMRMKVAALIPDYDIEEPELDE